MIKKWIYPGDYKEMSSIFADQSALVYEPKCTGRGEYTEPVFLNVYGAQESIPRNEFRQPM
jgi:hypothetical protein